MHGLAQFPSPSLEPTLPFLQETQRAISSKHRFPFLTTRRLFLSSLGLGLLPLALLAGALAALEGAGQAELPIGAALDGLGDVGLADLAEASGGGGDGQGGGDEVDLLDGGRVGLGVTLLRGVGAAGEDDEALLVGLEALDVDGEGLLAQVLAAAIDGDTDGGSEAAGDTSLLHKHDPLASNPRAFDVRFILESFIPSAQRG